MNRGLRYSIALSLASVISGCQTPQRETSSPLEQEVQVAQTSLDVEAPKESEKEINKVPKKYDVKDLTKTISTTKPPELMDYDKTNPPIFSSASYGGIYWFVSFKDTMPIGMKSYIAFNGEIKELERSSIHPERSHFKLPSEIHERPANPLDNNPYFTNTFHVWAVDIDGNESKRTALYATVRDNSKILAEKKD